MATQPHGSRSAGCFFKNPPAGTVGTGKMIDEMGMKGSRRGSAVISPVHANFIVTEGEGARAEDALALAEEIRERVKREHGIELEYEVELWRANEPKEKPDADDEQTDARLKGTDVREQVIAQKLATAAASAVSVVRAPRRNGRRGAKVAAKPLAARLRAMLGYVPAFLKVVLAIVVLASYFRGLSRGGFGKFLPGAQGRSAGRFASFCG